MDTTDIQAALQAAEAHVASLRTCLANAGAGEGDVAPLATSVAQDAFLYHHEQLVRWHAVLSKSGKDIDDLSFGPLQEAMTNTVETAVMGAHEAGTSTRGEASNKDGGEEEEAETPANILALKKKRMQKKLAKMGAVPAIGAGFALPRAGAGAHVLKHTSSAAAREMAERQAEASGRATNAKAHLILKHTEDAAKSPPASSLSQEKLAAMRGGLRAAPAVPKDLSSQARADTSAMQGEFMALMAARRRNTEAAEEQQ